MTEAADHHASAVTYEEIGKPVVFPPLSDAMRREFLRCVPWLEACLSRIGNTRTAADVWQSMEAGMAVFWPWANCMALTEIAIYAKRKVLEVTVIGGDEQEFMEQLEPRLVEFAAFQGCDLIAIIGDQRWSKEAKRFGYRFGLVQMIKDLKN